MMGFMSSMLGRTRAPALAKRERLVFDHRPAAIYAIGDIHGCYDELVAIERRIIDDAASVDGETWLVCLGDYIDRGPSSAAVLDHLTSAPPPGFRRFCMAGNHEVALMDFLDSNGRQDQWLSIGATETLASYGLYRRDRDSRDLARMLQDYLPEEHLDFLRGLPEMLVVPGYCFVHGMIDPALSLDMQTTETLLWSRPADFDWTGVRLDFRVVHGHTPTRGVEINEHRINIDVGAYMSGRLSAIKLGSDSVEVIET